uniref:Exocyst subunit Exo70 family protein n=1 Tax=Leersia perrieri TaxID=77586 RepID=A0A0D9WFR8_9ORYZ
MSTVESPALEIGTFDMEIPATQQQAEQDEIQLVQFAEATISQMLAFADALVADNTWQQLDKFSGLMDMHICITDVSLIHMPKVKQEVLWIADFEMQNGNNLAKKIGSVLLHTRDNLSKAIQNITNDATAVTPLLSGMGSWQSFPQSAEIHKAAQLIMAYATLFWEYHDQLLTMRSLDGAPHIIEKMVNNLTDQLEKKAESLSEPSLRYLFLLNNCYFIQEQFLAITCYNLPSRSNIRIKYCYYQNCYLNISWDTVLSCLHGKMPLCFSKPSPLARFKSESERTCKHQKLWKVPNTQLRKMLRQAIIDKVITGPTGYKIYLEAHPEHEKCGSDQEGMEDMVNELFEG